MPAAVSAACLLALAHAGCPRFTLPKDIVPLEAAIDCPALPAGEMRALRPVRTTPYKELACLLAAVRAEPSPDAALAAVATRAAFFLADQGSGHRAQRLASEGVRWAEHAIAGGLDRDGAVHYYLAMNLGVAVMDAVVLAVRNLPRLESELKRAIDLAPGEDQGGPVRVLGMLYLKAPSWPQGIGDQDRALELLSDAATTWPDHPANHVFYAQALWEVSGEDAREDIRMQLRRALDGIKSRDWGYAAERWRADVESLATSAGVPIL